jgi:hypothetical protein
MSKVAMSIGIGVDKPILHKPAGPALSAKKAMDFIMLSSIPSPLGNDMTGGDTRTGVPQY